MIRRVDCVILNDAELRELTGEETCRSGQRGGRLGPVGRRGKQGEYGAVLITSDVFFSIPAYRSRPSRSDRCRDTFAGASSAMFARHLVTSGHERARNAMAYGTALRRSTSSTSDDGLVELARTRSASRCRSFGGQPDLTWTCPISSRGRSLPAGAVAGLGERPMTIQQGSQSDQMVAAHAPLHSTG